jgi:Beta/Gamma crystallin
MNRIRLVFRSFKTVFVVMLLSGLVSNAYAVDKECWANFFEGTQYAGKRLFIEGPTKLENLNRVDGEDWNLRIHSIKVGPKAKVIVFQNPRFELPIPKMLEKPDLMRAWGITEQDIKEDSELIFNENAAIHDLGDFGFHKKIRSLKVECI